MLKIVIIVLGYIFSVALFCGKMVGLIAGFNTLDKKKNHLI